LRIAAPTHQELRMATKRGAGAGGARKRATSKRAGTKRASTKRAGTKSAAKRGTAKRGTAKRASAKRELIEPQRGDKRYVRRSARGKFTESQDDVGRSLSQDVKKRAKRTVPAGRGDEGDQQRRSGTKSGARKSAAKKSSRR
jgi:hypothetical protein